MCRRLGLILAAGVLFGCGGGTSPQDGAVPAAGPAAVVEEFLDTAGLDAAASDADWGATEAGFLTGRPVPVRRAYVYAYPHTWSGLDSGRGEYIEHVAPLIGADLGAPLPPTSAGRRVQLAIRDTELGPAGIITGVAWGPAHNRTVAATYPNVRLRMGTMDLTLAGAPSLSTSIAANYETVPTLLYDGPYSVSAVPDVGNTPGHPTAPHIGGYPQSPNCNLAPGGWNAQLFDHTGWYDWPAFTTYFAWDPGNPLVDDDRVLLFDASVQEGTATQRMRGWAAVTFPCSGILIGGHPEPLLATTYEGMFADPADNAPAGIVNPSPVVMDVCITFGRLTSVAQSRFFTGAYGDDTNYLSPVIAPATQPAGAAIVVEFQGADAVQADGVTIDPTAPSTAWLRDVSGCNGMRHIRFRISMTSGMDAHSMARVDRITVPMADATP